MGKAITRRKVKEVAGYVDDAPFPRSFSFRRPDGKKSRAYRGVWYAVAPAEGSTGGVIKGWVEAVCRAAREANAAAGRVVCRPGVAVEVTATFVATYGVMRGRAAGTHLVTKRMRAALLRTGRFKFVSMNSEWWARYFLAPAARDRVRNEAHEMFKRAISRTLKQMGVK